jgi:hypothetical protein
MSTAMIEQDYTFKLSPGGSTRYTAGPYSQETCAPRYEIKISVPRHVHNLIEIQQFLTGTEGNRTWGWDLKNRSNYLVFVIITKDGSLVRMS